MIERPDFSRYTEKQLRQILRMLDGERYPDRLKEIEARLAAFDASKQNEVPLAIPEECLLISSKLTKFTNVIFPVIWFGGGLLLAFVFLISNDNGIKEWLLFLVFFIFGIVIQATVNRLVEEVYLAEDRLFLVRSGDKELILLKSISKIEVLGGESTTVVLHLNCSTKFGNKIEFAPAVDFSLNPFKEIAVVDELNRRIVAAKAQLDSLLASR